MKKMITSVLLMTMLINITATSVDAVSDLSAWAVTEVKAAISENLVPPILAQSFKSNIKRYEYVLMALSVLDLKQDKVDIEVEYPFADIRGHKYEDEMVRAYNAGIIKGYGDGTFRPNDYITRQEIASLMVNLVQRLTRKDVGYVFTTTSYSDKASISDWSKSYINYCYKNDIIKGIGRDDKGKPIIQPLGLATREQAIIMLYRLAKKENLLSDTDIGTVTLYEYVDQVLTPTKSDVINDFARLMGLELAEYVMDLSKEEGTKVLALSADYCMIELANKDTLTISHNGYSISFAYKTRSLDENYLAEYYEMIKLADDSAMVSEAVTRDIPSLSSDVAYRNYLEVSDKTNYKCSVINGDQLWYSFNVAVNFD